MPFVWPQLQQMPVPADRIVSLPGNRAFQNSVVTYRHAVQPKTLLSASNYRQSGARGLLMRVVTRPHQRP